MVHLLPSSSQVLSIQSGLTKKKNLKSQLFLWIGHTDLLLQNFQVDLLLNTSSVGPSVL